MANYYSDAAFENYYRNRFEREYGYDPLEGPYADEEDYDDEWEESDEV